ncbi:Wzz/FepE/Etk N-terminal domain-containing protein [Mucilaginibacter aquaedulcis]|uniref:Wzz/FepE/Etk N-terminal domain-containing protein n=1 Tax=Mucilaginibacter aquaedulcis TaxID=1187081 RepID=UPI0025B4FBCF|nr:Wzz/FepE/Etk N-terminal domain-containing protein [Mucilaginibacter aquaedulcis]MDN3547642.1 Wzz/FepE/Etk N-terminal domain-containing protein [Mucilaginibacter aquaedulcis]
MTTTNKTDNGSGANNSEDISLKELILKMRSVWSFLLSKWVIIVIAGIVGSALGLGYAFIKKPLYTAELSFATEDDKSSSGGGLGGALGLASQFGIDLGSNGGGAFSGDNLLELMKSRSIVEKVLLSTIIVNNKEQTLADLYISFNKMRDDWKNEPTLKDVDFLPNADRSKFSLGQNKVLSLFYTKILKKNLTVDKIDKKLSIINITVISENEIFSKYFAEILAKTVSDFYINTKTKKSVQNVNILQRQTDSVRSKLDAAIGGVASSADINPNANPALQILRVPSQRRQVDVQANTAILNQLVANLELAKVSLRKETPLIQIIDRPILPLDKESFGKVKGIILGGIAGVFLVSFILLIRRMFKMVMA